MDRPEKKDGRGQWTDQFLDKDVLEQGLGDVPGPSVLHVVALEVHGRHCVVDLHDTTRHNTASTISSTRNNFM